MRCDRSVTPWSATLSSVASLCTGLASAAVLAAADCLASPTNSPWRPVSEPDGGGRASRRPGQILVSWRGGRAPASRRRGGGDVSSGSARASAGGRLRHRLELQQRVHSVVVAAARSEVPLLDDAGGAAAAEDVVDSPEGFPGVDLVQPLLQRAHHSRGFASVEVADDHDRVPRGGTRPDELHDVEGGGLAAAEAARVHG
mmetsp:Transcript_15859/g.47576  ORF Transcript_15859/g.47576 Transcript_15859/m.47576 type:complete len:200 (+) Transcript_15859:44-643(+)